MNAEEEPLTGSRSHSDSAGRISVKLQPNRISPKTSTTQMLKHSDIPKLPLADSLERSGEKRKDKSRSKTERQKVCMTLNFANLTVSFCTK